MVTTNHNYLDLYPIKESDSKLIIGTIHPHNTSSFRFPFYYGNVGSFWKILEEAFPEKEFNSLEEIKRTLSIYNTAVTDIIRQCDRDDDSITQDSKLYNITLNDRQISDSIRGSHIDTIYFTSRFGRNSAAKLFTTVFGIKYKETYVPETSEFCINECHFGRTIRAVVLYSPSGEANRGIARSTTYLSKRNYFTRFQAPIKQFKIEFYREKFNFLSK